jgi:hypothetical protein
MTNASDDRGDDYEYEGGEGSEEDEVYAEGGFAAGEEYERPDEAELYDQSDFENEGQLPGSDTLDGSPTGDPLDTGTAPPDRWSAGERFGDTEAEERAGESLDQLLAEEEPDVDPYAAAGEGEDESDDEPPAAGDVPEPRAGRLVAEDEGIAPPGEPDLVGRDVGIDAGAATAEEAAVHVSDEDEDLGNEAGP